MRQEDALAALKAHGPMTVAQLLEAIGVENTHVAHTRCNSALRRMHKWGEVDKVAVVGVGRHKAIVWAVVE